MENFDVFERLQETMKTLELYDQLVNKIRYWLSNEEIEDFKTVRARLIDDIEVMKEFLFERDICPYCCGEIKHKTITDNEVGNVTFVFCEDCRQKFDD